MSVESLISEDIFCCPSCTYKPLGWQSSSAYCSSCRRTYPIKSGVIDFFCNYDTALSGNRKANKLFVQVVADHFGFPTSKEVHLALAEAIESTQLVVNGSNSLTAEIREFASRMQIAEKVWEDEDIINTSDTKSLDIKPNGKLHPLISFEQHYIGKTLPVNQEIFRSIRIRNIGTTPIDLTPESPVCLSYHWLDFTGGIDIYEGLRSPLPRDLSPNDCLTVVTKIKTPSTPGSYILRVCLMQEHVAWYDNMPLDIPVQISADTVTSLDNLLQNNDPFNYEHDVSISRELIMNQYGSGSKRILEIAGGVFPQSINLAGTGSKVYSVDVSFAMSQLGSLYYQYVDKSFSLENFCFLCSDAMQLPFQKEQFDGIVICAALHHFPDPVALLRKLGQLLRPEGAFLIVREPCNPNPWDIDYLKDIRNGINEQMWTLAEYDLIFKSAGLYIETGRIDSLSSLKVVLKKAK